MSAYAAALVLWSWVIGVPSDPGLVLVWLWVGTVAWHVGSERRFHLNFLKDWSLPILLLVVYFVTRGFADQLGIAVHVTEPIEVDRWLGGGRLPTEVLQEAWCGPLPCRTDDPQWYDVLFTTTYATHFLAGLTIAVILWMRNRVEWVKWMRRYLTTFFIGVMIYLVYPMAPPWWAAQEGYLNADLHRITGMGWHDIGLGRVNLLLAGLSNKVAAMPSLHAGIACLIAVYAVQRLSSPWRWLLLLYPLVMGTALVYYAEHYVIDLIAGYLLAIAVLIGWQVWERRREPVRDRELAEERPV